MSKIIGNGGRYREIYDDSIYIHVFLREVWWVNEGMVRWMGGWVADWLGSWLACIGIVACHVWLCIWCSSVSPERETKMNEYFPFNSTRAHFFPPRCPSSVLVGRCESEQATFKPKRQHIRRTTDTHHAHRRTMWGEWKAEEEHQKHQEQEQIKRNDIAGVLVLLLIRILSPASAPAPAPAEYE